VDGKGPIEKGRGGGGGQKVKPLWGKDLVVSLFWGRFSCLRVREGWKEGGIHLFRKGGEFDAAPKGSMSFAPDAVEEGKNLHVAWRPCLLILEEDSGPHR